MFNKVMIKQMLFSECVIFRLLLFLLNRMPFNNRFKTGSRNTLKIKQAIILRSKITLKGKNNKVLFGKGCHFKRLRILVSGDNNTVIFRSNITGNDVEVVIEDNGNSTIVGDNTVFAGKIHLACTESSRIEIGNNCLFSSEIEIRTGDSHSIIDIDSRERINQAKNVCIGNHVWVGRRVIMTKGSGIPDDSIVGTGSIVTKQFCDCNTVFAGVPATIIRKGVDWLIERV